MKKTIFILILLLFISTIFVQQAISQRDNHSLNVINSDKSSPAKVITEDEHCAPVQDLTVRYTSDCEAKLSWSETAKKTPPLIASRRETISPAPKGMVNVTLESYELGYRYQLLLDQTATQYGLAIPLSGPFSYGCSLASDYYDVFSYTIPENAEPICTSENSVFNESVTIQIPVGVYDLCVAQLNPNADWGNISVVGENMGDEYSGRRDDFLFEEGYDYLFSISNLGYGNGLNITRPCASISNLDIHVTNYDVELTWNAAPGSPSGYQILRNGTILDTVFTTSYNDNDLADGLYTYAIKTLFDGDCDQQTVYSESIIVGTVCNLRFEVFDSHYNWDGDAAVLVEVDGISYGEVKLMENMHASVIKLIPPGEVKLYWVRGDYDEECELEVYDHKDQLLWATPSGNGMTDYNGLFFTYQNDCDGEPPVPTVYNIYRDGILIKENHEETSYTDIDFDIYEGHSWSIKAICEDNQSELITVTLGSCQILPAGCLPVNNLALNYTDNCEVELTWDTPNRLMQTLPQWEVNTSRVKKQPAINPTAAKYPVLNTEKDKAFFMSQEDHWDMDYATAYVLDLFNEEYTSINLTTGLKTSVSEIPDISASPTGEDYNGIGLYRLYENGLVFFVHEDGSVSEVGRISNITNSIGLAYDWIKDDGTWYFYDIQQKSSSFEIYLYSLDMISLRKTLISTISSNVFCRGLAIDNEGTFYALDMTEFNLVKFANEQIITIGALGFEFAYGQDLAFDREINTLYASPLNMTNPYIPTCQFGTLDMNTGIFSEIRNYQNTQHATLSIVKGKKEDVPAAPTNFMVTPIGSSLKSDIFWNNPSTTLGGNALSTITKMVLLRNGSIVQEFTDVALGAAMSCHVEVPEIGEYIYSLYAVSDQNNGVPAYNKVYSGDFCHIRFEMTDHYTDGWAGGAITVEVDGVNYGEITLLGGAADTEIIMIPSGELKLYWTDSDYNQECGLQVYDANDQLLFSSGPPTEWTTPCAPGLGMCGMTGLFFTYQYECGGVSGDNVYNIYRDNILIEENYPFTSYIDTVDTTIAHTWAVTAVCQEEESEAVIVNGDPCVMKYTISLDINPVEGGTVTGDGVYDHNAAITIAAMANTNYDFVNWTEDGNEVSIDENYSFTVIGDRTLVANFIRKPDGIDEVGATHLRVYPNPTTGKITVESNSETIKCIYILDVAGKVIDGLDNINRNKTEIDLTGLSKGIYFLKINEQIDKVIKK